MSSVTSTSTVNSVFKQLSESKTGSTSDAEQMSDRFMTLLVTQMQNQDPLNPLDNAELTSQLAQINTVKGIDSLNSTLQKLLTSYSDALSMQSSWAASSWPVMRTRSASPSPMPRGSRSRSKTWGRKKPVCLILAGMARTRMAFAWPTAVTSSPCRLLKVPTR